ncbi:MAG: cob(I)yrinic acid a,c-diamide adenosyltransferase [Mangrovibacterium sp.]
MKKAPRIYTRTGDDGTTGLVGGTRVKKYDIRLEAYGTVDELNSCIGLVLSTPLDPHARETLTTVQSTLFAIGSRLATEEQALSLTAHVPCSDGEVSRLEEEMDLYFEELPRLNYFILPAGCQGGAYAHLARTVCRRAERRMVELAEQTAVDPVLIRYVNRLSDYLFVLARKINRDRQYEEVTWTPEK